MHWLGYTALIGLPLFPALFLFATAAKWMQEYSSKILRCSVEITAQVIGAEKECVLNESGNNSSTWLHPVVWFSLRGKEFRVRCEERMNPLPFEIGDRVPIWYNPLDPFDVHLEGKYSGRMRNHTIPLVAALVFGLTAAGSVIFCIRLPL